MQEKLVMLLADDVEVNRASLKTMFCDEYEILEAENGQKAMQILYQKKVDIVILDVHMPMIDGVDVLGQMKADSTLRDIPVIAKTAVDENLEVKMLEKGADDFIFSPCEPAVIKNRVRNIMQKYVFRQMVLQRKIEEEQHFSKVREKLIMRVANGMKDDANGILALCQTEGACDLSEKERLQGIEEYTLRLIDNADKLLNEMKIEQEEKILQSLPFQLSGVITDLTREYMAVCQKKGILFTMKNSEAPYDDLVGDAKRLKQVWGRAIKNVIDNTSPGGSISTSFQQRVTGKGKIDLEITVRGNIDPNAEYPLAASIVELLRGSMIVEDEEGRGIVSVITLPFKIGKAPLRRQKKLANLKALVLDDNELTRQYHTTSLMRLGITCDAATNGANAIHMLRKAYTSGKSYDICFVNWYMVGASDIIKEIREMIPRERMVIASSSNELDEDEEVMKASGVDFVLERPIQQAELYQFVTDICNNTGEKTKIE